MRVTILDCGLGNLRSVALALTRAGGEAVISDDPAAVASAERLVFPGQGAFRDCSRAMQGPLGDAVRAFLASGRPYLGICLGLQVLFDESDEGGRWPGLGVLRGRVERLAAGQGEKIPHMGWNEVHPSSGQHPALAALAPGERFYFVHSYRGVPAEPGCVALTCDYGEGFAAAVVSGALLAVQFHPEKSQAAGLHLLRGWLCS